MVETVERLLRAPSQMGLYTRAQCLEYLGSMFRGTLDVPARFTDLQVGQMGMLVRQPLTGASLAATAQKPPGSAEDIAQGLDCRHCCNHGSRQ